MWTHLRPRRPTHHLPNPLLSQRLPPHTQKQSPRHHPPSLHQLRPTHRQISLQRLNRRAPQRNNPLLIALPSHLRPPLVKMQILNPQRTNLPHPQSPPPYSTSKIACSRSPSPSASAARAATPVRSSISATSPSASDFGSTFQLD